MSGRCPDRLRVRGWQVPAQQRLQIGRKEIAAYYGHIVGYPRITLCIKSPEMLVRVDGSHATMRALVGAA